MILFGKLFGRSRKGPQIADQNVRFEIAWTIPRKAFMDPKKAEGSDAPWWAEDAKHRSEMAAEPRYLELKAVVLQYGGEIALYRITTVKGEEELKEQLVRYDGPNKAPLRKDVLPTPPGLAKELADLENVVRSRRPQSAPSGGSDRQAARRRAKPKRGLIDVVFAAVMVANGLAAAAIAAFFVYRALPEPHRPPPPPVSEDFYYSTIVNPVGDGSRCELYLFDNRTGRQSYRGTLACTDAKSIRPSVHAASAAKS